MEPYIKNNVNDITYKSELIPPSYFRKKAGGINSPKQLMLYFVLHKLWAH